MRTILLAIIVALTFQRAFSQHQPSTVKESKKIFKTYGFSDPDPIAKPAAPIYPYYRFDGYTNTSTEKEWKVVELENEFIRVMILPEIGGKIWAAWDKSTGKPFIYYNQVVKFRDVAMRGPWTSGGIEANYGIIGHTPNCATPMDYMTESKDDGSVSCYIGTLDLLTQTYWTIEINLPSDKGYFSTRSFWHNSTSLEQPYYTWMNAGIKAAGNLEFIYPGNRYIGHSGEYADWKINRENGKDISFYDQNNFGEYKSYHVFGKYTDFFGAYWHKDNFGMARYSTHDEKPGKKIWIWGLSQQGMIWETLLSDVDGQYVEVQSGRLFNQSADGSTFTPFKHRGFAPASSDSWTEYWFPVKNTKGFVQANPLGALNIRAENGLLKINFSPNEDVREDLKVVEDNKVIYTKTIDLKPLQPFADSIEFKGNGANLVVTLGNKMRYASNPQDGVLNRPVDAPTDFDWTNVQGLYQLGKENIRERYYLKAEEKLLAVLAKDPNYLPALGDLSMLMYRKMDYQKSLDFARHALSIDTYDPAGNFYYGLSNLQLGNRPDAKDGFDIAAQSVEYRSAAFLELSKLYLQDKDFDKSLAYANKSLDANAQNEESFQIIALVNRLTGEKNKAKIALDKVVQLNPLNHFLRFETFRWDNSNVSKDKFTSMIRNEMTQDTYLQLADWYLSLGLEKESLEVLSCAPPNAESYYWMAYLKAKLNVTSNLIEQANRLSPELIFPFRSRSAEILRWVISQSQDWKPKYYLALIEWSRNNPDRAKELFEKCGNPDFAPFYASRAALQSNEHAADDLKRAAQLDPTQWRYGKLLINHFVEKKNYSEALVIANEYHKRFPADFRLNMLLANALLLNKQYKACLDLLNHTVILPNEGATDGRQLYHEACLMVAVGQIQSKNYKAALTSIKSALLWPENLGVGKPYDEDIDIRLENYAAGLCYEKTNATDQATKKWNEIAGFKSHRNNANTLISALALKKLGKSDEGEQLLSGWAQKEPESKLARWCLEVYHGSKPTEEEMGNANFRIVKALFGW